MQHGSIYERRIEKIVEKCRLSGFESLTSREAADFFLWLAASEHREKGLFHSYATANPLAFFSYSEEKLVKNGANESEAFLIGNFAAVAERLLSDRDSKKSSGNAARSNDKKIEGERQKQKLESIIMSRYVGVYNEKAFVMFFNEKYILTYYDFISSDKTDSVDLDVRLICRLACKHGAKYVLAAHNHPSGMSVPSPQDCISTRELYVTLRDLGVVLLDHYIVTRTECVSMSSTYNFRDLSDEYLASVCKKLKNEYDKSDRFPR